MAEHGRPTAVGMDGATFRRLGHDLVERVAAVLEGIPGRPVTAGTSPADVRAALDWQAPLPESGSDAAAALETAADLLTHHGLFNAHPRFFGYVTAPPAPIGILGDFLAAAVNPNVGAWTLSPMATEMEAQTVRWIAELVGYPVDAGGLLVSGGNMANMVGFWAARAAAASWPVREAGMQPGALRVYASAGTHTWVQKAADLSGLGTEAIRWIPVDGEERMRLAELRGAIAEDRAAGLRPMMVVGSAGTVSTGAVDPLREMAALCRAEGIWLHVDGAYGAFAAAVPGTPDDLAVLGEADSVALDPHKWLYAPLEAGCALVRNREALRAAFAYHPPYYHFGDEATNYVDLGPQNSRGFRALKVWLALKQAGRAGYVASLGEDIRLARRLHDRTAGHEELEPATQGLSITTFRYVPRDLRAGIGEPATEAFLNTLNERLLDTLQRSGEAFVSNAVVEGRYLLRACIVNFHTTEADVDALPEIVARTGAACDEALRSPLPAPAWDAA